MTSPADWARCRPWIEAALTRAGGTHAIEDVEAGIEAGEYQFWAGAKSAVITEIHDHPRLKVAFIWLLGGSLKDAVSTVLPCIETWARIEGCARVMGGGYARPGWARALAPAGFHEGWMIYSKELAA